MNRTQKVVVVQMEIDWLNPQINLSRLTDTIKKASVSGGVDLIVFPELALTGNVIGSDQNFRERYYKMAETIPGPSTEAVGSVARQSNAYVAFGICEKHLDIPAMIYNSAVLIGPKGELVGVQRKIHIPGEERHFFAPGNCINVFKTHLGTLGLLICYDAFFPEIPRIQSLMGAEVICGLFNVPKKKERSPARLHYLAATRANENMNFFICCNRVGQQGEKSYLANSAVGAPPGELLAYSTNDKEELISVILERDLVIRERAARPVFRDRRAELYTKICDL